MSSRKYYNGSVCRNYCTLFNHCWWGVRKEKGAFHSDWTLSKGHFPLVAWKINLSWYNVWSTCMFRVWDKQLSLCYTLWGEVTVNILWAFSFIRNGIDTRGLLLLTPYTLMQLSVLTLTQLLTSMNTNRIYSGFDHVTMFSPLAIKAKFKVYGNILDMTSWLSWPLIMCGEPRFQKEMPA